MAEKSVGLQVNFKTADGTLINIYAADQANLEAQLAAIQDTSALISSVSKTLSEATAGNVAVSAIKKSFPSAAPMNGDAPTCQHGPMQFREGMGQKGPWKGWMCSAPKGAKDKCETVWVR